MNGLSEGYKQAVDQNWGCMAKTGFLAKNQDFGPKKSVHICTLTMFWPRPEKSCSKKKGPFAQIIKGGNVILGDFLG